VSEDFSPTQSRQKRRVQNISGKGYRSWKNRICSKAANIPDEIQAFYMAFGVDSHPFAVQNTTMTKKVILDIKSHPVNVTKNVIGEEVTYRFNLGGALGGQIPKGLEVQGEEVCQVIRGVRQQVPRGWDDVPVVGNIDLRCNGHVARHVLWEECKEKEICERRGAGKIQIVIKTLGTGQGVMYTGQVVKIECFKVKFEWLKGQRSVQHPEDIQVNGYTPRECTSACKVRGFW